MNAHINLAKLCLLFLSITTMVFSQAQPVVGIQTLHCLTNDTIAVNDPFPASLRAECNHNDTAYRTADTAIEADNFRITYNPFANLGSIDGNAICDGTCNGGMYQLHSSPSDYYKNVRSTEGGHTFLDSNTAILGEDIIVHLPKGFNGPREHAAGIASGRGRRDVVVMLHGGGGVHEAALSQLANLHSIQDAGPNGPVLLIPNSGNNLHLSSHKWAWDAWSTSCQTTDTAYAESGSLVRFHAYTEQSVADNFDDGFDDACASDLRRLLKLAADLKTHNKWIRRVILAGFSSGGYMTKTVMCTYPAAYDGYVLFEHGTLIGTAGQNLCGNLDTSGIGFPGFVSRRIDSLIGIIPGDLAVSKPPLFQVCSDQDDACSSDLGTAWHIHNGIAVSAITNPELEHEVFDHTDVNNARRDTIALVRNPDSAALATVGRGQFDWKLSGLEVRAQTTLQANLPTAAALMIPDSSLKPPECRDAAGAYDTRFCAFADANDNRFGPDDNAFQSILSTDSVGEHVVTPPDDILAVRYVEKRNGAAYGYIEVHGGGHTIHGYDLRAGFGKTRDFDGPTEMLKFMAFANSGPVTLAPRARPPLKAGIHPKIARTVRFGDRNSLGRHERK